MMITLQWSSTFLTMKTPEKDFYFVMLDMLKRNLF